jgi:hypothetical protein
MTAEEFTQAADLALTPAIMSVVRFAFETVPPENVATLVASRVDRYKELAVEAVRVIIATQSKH